MILICYAIINRGRDTIKTKVDLNLISNNITKLLKDNKSYLPLSNDCANILSQYEEQKQNFNEIIERLNKKLIQDTLIIHKNYSTAMENINSSLKIAIDKNEKEIKSFQDITEQKINFLQREIITSKKVYKESMELAKTKNSRANFNAEEIYNEEVISIEKELKDLRHKYRVILQKNDNQKQIKLKRVNEEYDEAKNLIEEKIANRRKITDREIEVLTNEINEQKTATDETYLKIKTTHTQANVRFNEFVNKRKAIKAKNTEKLQLLYDETLLPYEEKLNKFKKIYDNKLDAIQNEYADKLQALNVIFDVQKNAYNKKTKEIIKNNNNKVTEINAKFSSSRDQIEYKKDQANELHRERLLETSDESERNILYRQYQKDINKLNEQLSKEIEINNKLISEQEIKLQLRLYNHDSTHIEQINKWRHSKNIYEYERNQQFLKVKHEHEINERAINLELDYLKLKLNNEKAIENINLNKDLQPIETQLTIASLVQEREINLLNTENETYQNAYNLKKSLSTNYFFKDELLLKQQMELLTENKNYNISTINIQHQLELEQMRQRRDHEIYVLNLNKKLQNSLLMQKKNIEQIKLDANVYQNNLNINNLDARLNYETKLFRQKSLLEFEKRQKIISEIKLKNQRLAINEKNKRTLLLAEADLELHQSVNSILFKELYNAYNFESQLYQFIKDLFKLPTHPEVFRQTFNNISNVFNIINEYSKETIKIFVNIDNDLYEKRINKITEYKYRIKHEELIDLYSNNIEQVTKKRSELLKNNVYITTQIRVDENKKLLNDALIENYKIDRNKAKKVKDKYGVTHAKAQIKTLISQKKLLNSNIKQSERNLIRLTNKITPLDKEIKRIKTKQLKAEKKLKNKKYQEELKYQKLMKKHNNQYNTFIKAIDKRFNSLNALQTSLINKPYISSDYFESIMSKMFKNQQKYQLVLNKNQQKLLNNWLELFKITKADQNKVIESLNKITNYSLNKINKMHNKFIKDEKRENVYLSKIYLNETKRNDDYINKSISNSSNKIKVLQNNYHANYNNTELQIDANLTKTKKSISVIMENLKGVLEQLKIDNTSNLLKIRQTIKKNNKNLVIKINDETKAINEINKRNVIRTSAIIARYNRRKERRYKLMQSIVKKLQTEITNLNDNTKEAANYLEAELKNNVYELVKYKNKISKNIKKYEDTSRREQNKITKKEKKTLKDSYKFKRKQIKAKNK